jgi:hypothetical protein
MAHWGRLSGPHRQGASGEFPPGQVFWLPPGATWLNQDKSRPFALATACSPARRGTLVYGSTQDTARKAGAASIEVAPNRNGLNRNGLWATTRFYPGVLLRTSFVQLPDEAGRLGKSLDDLRAALRIAFGIGQGSCARPGAPARSRRGRIVELQPALAGDLRTRFAVLLTEPWYSRAKHYQIILPVYSGEGRRTNDDWVLGVSSRSWLAVFPERTRTALLPIQVTQSVWYADDIARETEHVLDEDTLAEIDQRLCAYFSLPEPEG